MTDQIPETLLHEGLNADLLFAESKPISGDLYNICGGVHLNFPPTGEFGFV